MQICEIKSKFCKCKHAALFVNLHLHLYLDHIIVIVYEL